MPASILEEFVMPLVSRKKVLSIEEIGGLSCSASVSGESNLSDEENLSSFDFDAAEGVTNEISAYHENNFK
jgi:hypothetical protein